MVNMKDLAVAVLYGGTSGERAVSLVSGTNVHQALEAEGFKAALIDTGEPDFMDTLAHSGAHVAFIALHGKGGEDGTIQGLLELLGMPYTGSGVLASALAMDKARSKVMYRATGLRTPHAVAVDRTDDESAFGGAANDIETLVEKVGLPCVVKPVCDGSSLGVSIVKEAAALLPALEEGFALGDELLVEAFVEGVEVTVPVLGDQDPYALPVIEIIPKNEFYDYESKYASGGSQHIIPARLSPEVTAACEEAALRAHKALGCRGVSRTDIIIDAANVPWVIETNTIPGMTGTSLLPEAARISGIPAGELYTRLIEWALQR
jgi:D-alanine-D-alanine ligase